VTIQLLDPKSTVADCARTHGTVGAQARIRMAGAAGKYEIVMKERLSPSGRFGELGDEGARPWGAGWESSKKPDWPPESEGDYWDAVHKPYRALQ